MRRSSGARTYLGVERFDGAERVELEDVVTVGGRRGDEGRRGGDAGRRRCAVERCRRRQQVVAVHRQ